jgi:molybdopterin-guanine dinucleotide biosynthesis protein A
MSRSEDTVLGVILAGGGGRRFGGRDKAFISLAGQSLVAHAIGRLAPQVEALLVNANGDAARFSSFGLPVVADTIENGGPLAGVLAAMEWALKNRPGTGHVLSVAVDTPFFPQDYREKMMRRLHEDKAVLACAVSSGRLHPVFCLWPIHLAGELRMALVNEGLRKVRVFINRYACARVSFAPRAGQDPFFNINRAEDQRAAQERFIRRG